MTSSHESAFAALDRLRSGDFDAAHAIVNAANARQARTDPFLAAARLHLGRVAVSYADSIDAAALWQTIARTGTDDAIAFFGGAYAATIGESLAACEILGTALRGGASLAASLETIVIAAELGDGPLRARALAKLEDVSADASPGLRGVCDHAAALAERSGGHADRAHVHATRARVAYARAGWNYYAARADELCGNERAAMRVYGRLGATHDLERLAANANGRRAGALTSELSPRERDVADLVAQGLANKAIAETLHISTKTVEKNITALYAKLGVTKRVQLARRVSPSTTPSAPAAGNLSEPITPFIGRAEELADLRERLDGNRLITLVGAGGSGKSRLAVELALRERSRFSAGAWFIDGASLNDATAVLPSIAGTLGMPRDATRPLGSALAAWLAERDPLLVLDNCEHVLTGVARVVRTLLEAAPNLRIVATSRQRLGVFGENVMRVGPMRRSDGMAFFLDRAAAAGATVGDEDLAAQLCDRLDCVPLAIELAAARLYDLSLRELAGAIEGRLPVLQSDEVGIAPRHRSIDTLVDWGYEPLAPEQQRIFRHLAVFGGAFPLEAAITLFGNDAFSGLESLHRKSLVDRLPSGGYRMLQVVRDVALAKLRAHGEERAAFAAFANYYDGVLETASTAWYTTSIAAWIGPLKADSHNILAAINWCLAQENDIGAGVRMTANAAKLWSEMGREPELEPSIVDALRRSPDAAPRVQTHLWLARARHLDVMRAGPAALEASHHALEHAQENGDEIDIALAHLAIGASAATLQDAALAQPHLEVALATFRARGLQRSEAAALTALAIIATDDVRRVNLFADVITIAHTLADPLLEAISLSNLGVAYGNLGDVAAARANNRAAVDIFERLGAPTRLARSQLTLAKSELEFGDVVAARATAHKALDYFADLDSPLARTEAAEFLAETLIAADPSLAMKFLGYAKHAREGMNADAPEPESFARLRAAAAARLGDAACARLIREGAAARARALLAELPNPE